MLHGVQMTHTLTHVKMSSMLELPLEYTAARDVP